MTNIKNYAIILIVALIASVFAYSKGRNDGVSLVQYEVLKERQKWQNVVNTNQEKYSLQINQISKDYSIQIHDLNKQIQTLKDNPTIITKYIKPEENFNLPNGMVYWHDRLVKGEIINTYIPDNSSLSKEYSLYNLCDTLSVNYTRCNECFYKLNTLQKIVKEYQDKQNEIIKNVK